MHCRLPQETGCPLSAREWPQLHVPGGLHPRGPQLEAAVVCACIVMGLPFLVLELGGGPERGLQGCLGWRHSTALLLPSPWTSQALPGSAPAKQTADHMYIPAKRPQHAWQLRALRLTFRRACPKTGSSPVAMQSFYLLVVKVSPGGEGSASLAACAGAPSG